MNPIQRQKSMLEVAMQSKVAGTNPAIRELLELQSAEETQAQLTAGFIPFNEAVVDVEARQDAVEAMTVAMSGDVATMALDAYNLDLSVNAQIDTLFDDTASTATSGSATLPAGPEGFIIVSVNGVNKKIPYYNA